jgi:hypothetical protein
MLDLGRRGGQIGPAERMQKDGDNVQGVAVVQQWEERGIASIAAIPGRLAVNDDRVVHERQADSGQQRFCR